jgi:sulfatase maturation enzyme AslB (radical SAM superfamily)
VSVIEFLGSPFIGFIGFAIGTIIALVSFAYAIRSNRRRNRAEQVAAAVEGKFVLGGDEYVRSAAKLIAGAQGRVLSLLSEWHTDEVIFEALEESRAPTIVLCGPVVRGARLPAALRRALYCDGLNRTAEVLKVPKRIDVMDRKQNGPKFIVADNTVLLSDSLGGEEGAPRAAFCITSRDHAELFARVFRDTIRREGRPAAARLRELVMKHVAETGTSTLPKLSEYLRRGEEVLQSVETVFEDDLLRTLMELESAGELRLERNQGSTVILGFPGAGRSDEPRVDIKPYLSLALTAECGLHCAYCPPGGEGYGTAPGLMPLDLAVKVVRAASHLGMRKIRLTGGEPLLYPHIEQVLECIADQGMEAHVNTNGAQLGPLRRVLERSSGLRLKVSLDSLDRARFKRINGTDGLPDVLSGIASLAESGVVARLGTVITRLNYTEVEGAILNYCSAKRIGLKLLEMYGVPERNAIWRDLYVPPEALPMVGRTQSQDSYSQCFGIPVIDRVVQGVPVRIKDSRRGTRYHSHHCAGCTHYPCQEGLYCMVVTPSMEIVPCRLATDRHFAFGSESDLSDVLSHVVGIFKESSWVDGREGYWQDKEPFYAEKLKQHGLLATSARRLVS